jgi:hypothetical protein
MQAKAKINDIDRQIASALIETKAINFDAVGKVVSQFGPSSMLMDGDGWIRWCGSDLRIYRWPRQRWGLEEIEVLRDMIRMGPAG